MKKNESSQNYSLLEYKYKFQDKMIESELSNIETQIRQIRSNQSSQNNNDQQLQKLYEQHKKYSIGKFFTQNIIQALDRYKKYGINNQEIKEMVDVLKNDLIERKGRTRYPEEFPDTPQPILLSYCKLLAIEAWNPELYNNLVEKIEKEVQPWTENRYPMQPEKITNGYNGLKCIYNFGTDDPDIVETINRISDSKDLGITVLSNGDVVYDPGKLKKDEAIKKYNHLLELCKKDKKLKTIISIKCVPEILEAAARFMLGQTIAGLVEHNLNSGQKSGEVDVQNLQGDRVGKSYEDENKSIQEFYQQLDDLYQKSKQVMYVIKEIKRAERKYKGSNISDKEIDEIVNKVINDIREIKAKEQDGQKLQSIFVNPVYCELEVLEHSNPDAYKLVMQKIEEKIKEETTKNFDTIIQREIKKETEKIKQKTQAQQRYNQR